MKLPNPISCAVLPRAARADARDEVSSAVDCLCHGPLRSAEDPAQSLPAPLQAVQQRGVLLAFPPHLPWAHLPRKSCREGRQAFVVPGEAMFCGEEDAQKRRRSRWWPHPARWHGDAPWRGGDHRRMPPKRGARGSLTVPLGSRPLSRLLPGMAGRSPRLSSPPSPAGGSAIGR